MRRVHRRAPRRAPVPALPDVERYFGPATIEVASSRGTWSPRVDAVGLGCDDELCTIEAVLYDREVRPTLPWWLRTTSPADLTLHGTSLRVRTPVLRRRGRRTILRWTAALSPLLHVFDGVRSLPVMFLPMLARPLTVEERAVVRDYLLSTGDDALAGWFE